MAAASLCVAGYYYLIFGWVKPGVQGKFYIYKRGLQTRYYNKAKRDPDAKRLRWNPTPIDVVIPVISKDYETLIWTVKNIRTFVMHNIGEIYIVSRNDEQIIKDFAASNDCIFIDEKTILPNFKETPTSGWIIQQFIKLNADTFVKNDYYLVMDADTIPIRPVTFIHKNKLLLQFNDEYGYKRKIAAASVLKLPKVHNMDFTAHHMLFQKSKLAEMKQYIENAHGKPWFEVVLNQIDVAEYELYANYMLHFHPDETMIVAAKNLGILRKQLKGGVESIQNALNKEYKSISAHYFWQEREL